MPPEISHCIPIITSKTPLLSRVPSKSHFKRILHPMYCQGRMKFTKKKLIPVLVFILFSASLFRFLNISMISIFSVPQPRTSLPPVYQHECSSASSICKKNRSTVPSKGRSPSSTNLTEKETQFLLRFFSRRVPCNQLLKEARENPVCLPKFHLPKVSKCNLQLLNLPQEVYDTMWDVVMVDGPFGGTPDSPGRMASIYTASLLARRENVTHVIVHDIDRMIEMWFSREFLCEENLFSSKGRFWHFQILKVPNATTFCRP